MTLRAGSAIASVRFERQGGAGSNVGGVVIANWRPLCGPFRGKLQPLRGGEQVLAGRLQGVEVYELTLRGCAAVRDLTTDDRAVDARDPARIFAIKNIQNPDGRGIEFVVLLERGKANG